MLFENKKINVNEQGRFSLDQLRAAVKGKVTVPEDNDYNDLRKTFYGAIDKRPAAIVRPVDADDVASVVSLAREGGVELAVRSGGHSIAGHCVSDGGLVLDLRDMKGLDIDQKNRTAWAAAGLTAGEFTAAAGAHGLAVGFGDTGTVGIGGITLGGGVGFLSRKYGMTIDNLLAAEMVTADGRILRVDAKTNPDLFWAIRGGGGNFGIITRFQYQMREVDHILGGMLFLPATPETIAAFIAEAEAAPDELSTIANVMPAPPMPFLPPDAQGKMVIMAMMVFAGSPDAGQKVMAKFRAIAKPVADLIRPMRYTEMFPAETGGDYHPTAASRTMMIDKIDRDIAKIIFEYLQASDAAMRVAQLRVMGGAIARVPEDATAYAHRKSRIMVNVAAFYAGLDEKAARETWVNDFSAALDQGNLGVYMNFLGDEGEQRVRAAYPTPTWNRLAAIKARYDPTNFFRMNQNIPPAVEKLQ